ncbi:hypothetical protein ACOBQB_07575 [Streptomyces sp. G5(2025)]|uniref:hypothetical protein n=1 Tax=Streptomyces sp. G5(2025) TaxID=3406628 RepID=UPI003C25EEEA
MGAAAVPLAGAVLCGAVWTGVGVELEAEAGVALGVAAVPLAGAAGRGAAVLPGADVPRPPVTGAAPLSGLPRAALPLSAGREAVPSAGGSADRCTGLPGAEADAAGDVTACPPERAGPDR